MDAHWTQVSATKYERSDGARVETKEHSDLWGWSDPDGQVQRNVRGKRTAVEAMAYVDEAWPLDGGEDLGAYALGPRGGPTTSRVGRYWKEIGREAQYPDELEHASPSSFARGVEYAGRVAPRVREEERAVSSREIERRLGQATPSAFARALGYGAAPSVVAPTHVEDAVRAELARPSSRAPAYAPLPAPVAIVPPSSRSAPVTLVSARPVTMPAPDTIKSTRSLPQGSARESQAPTRAWPPPGTPPSRLLREATPSRPPVRETTRTLPSPAGSFEATIEGCSAEAITAALDRNGGNVSAAARELDLTRNGLYSAMKRVLGWKPSPVMLAKRTRAGVAGARARWG